MIRTDINADWRVVFDGEDVQVTSMTKAATVTAAAATAAADIVFEKKV